MKCLYVRQNSQDGKYEYLSDPKLFHILPQEQAHYKNIVFLTEAQNEEKSFYIHSVGYEVSDPAKNLVNRLYTNWTILHYVTSGQGFFNEKPIKRGDCFVCHAGRPHSIRTVPSNTLSFYWIVVRHPNTFSFLPFGFPYEDGIFSYHFEKEMKQIMNEMLFFSSDTKDPHLFFISCLYELLSLHKAEFANPEKTRNQSHEQYVTVARNLLEESQYQLSVEQLSHYLGFSRKHFSLIFIEQTGISLRDYIVQNKMRIAKRRLQNGETSLKDLAYELGYSDYPSFSRAFKKEVGISPAQYASRCQSDRQAL